MFSFLGFILFVVLFLVYERKSVKREGIIFIRRTPRGRNTIDSIAKRSPGFWKAVGNVGVVVGVLALFFGVYILSVNAYQIFTAQATEGAGLLLPGPVSTTTSSPGLFIVPWWFWVIGIVILIVPHEVSHGIMARADRIRIKSVGWLFLTIIPGAFVEPDDNQVKKQKKLVKLRIYAAGSFANFVTGALLLLVAFLVISPAFVSSSRPAGLFFVSDANSSLSGLSGVITAVDGAPVPNSSALLAAITNRSAGESVMLTVINASDVNFYSRLEGVPPVVFSSSFSESNYTATFIDAGNRSVIGITVSQPVYLTSLSPAAVTLIRLLSILIIFTIGIGIVNLLPIKPLDGGLIFEELVPAGKFKPLLVRAVSSVVLLILIFNIVGPFVV